MGLSRVFYLPEGVYGVCLCVLKDTFFKELAHTIWGLASLKSARLLAGWRPIEELMLSSWGAEDDS